MRRPWRSGCVLWLVLVQAATIASLAAGEPFVASDALEFADPSEPLRPVVGVERSVLVEPGDTLLDVAFRNRVGFEAVANLNPDLDVWIPAPGSVVRLPTRTIMPRVEHEVGLVINIPEMRLYDFTVDDGPLVLAAAVGDAVDPTPVGRFEIRDKRVDPVWNVPQSIRSERPELAPSVPPGPENPLGSRWLRIGRTSYGVHGTNTKWSIGREATHGCVRLYEEDVRELFDRTPEGTAIEIVYQPYKWGRDRDRIYLEAHPDRYARHPDRLAEALRPIRESGWLDYVDIDRVWQTLDESRGVPVAVGTVPSATRP